MANILLIDDDKALCQLLTDYLSSEGYHLDVAHDGESGLLQSQQASYDLLLLDVMMPGMNGLTFLQQFRQHNSTPVLMLTAKGDELDRVLGLEMGADDYLPKPYSPRELVARIRALLRRVQLDQQTLNTQSTHHHFGDLNMDLKQHQIHCNGQALVVTTTEFRILQQLLTHTDQVVPKEQLHQFALGRSTALYDRSLDMHISNLRKKLSQAQSRVEIKTLRGVGFRLECTQTDAR